MNELFELEKLIEVNGLQNVAYILKDNDIFSFTGYKVLRGQEKKGFIKCSKLKYNGKIKLIYLSSEYKSLSELLPSLDSSSFSNILANLLDSVIEIKNNGFLNCLNIEISLDKIFVDINTLKTYLIYLPINIYSKDITLFEKKLRINIINSVSSLNSSNAYELNKVCSELANSAVTLEDVYKSICNDTNVVNTNIRTNKGKINYDNKIESNTGVFQPKLLVSSIGTSDKIEFCITKSEYVIGKNSSIVDGVISTNNAISRIHCKISYENNNYYIIDLNSANGTFINSKKIISDQPALLRNKDVLKLANMEFEILI